MKIKSFENIANNINTECRSQDKKWGEERNHENYTWLAIMTEEVGECAQASLQDEYGGEHAGTLRIELIQTAAVIFQWIDCLDRKEYDY